MLDPSTRALLWKRADGGFLWHDLVVVQDQAGIQLVGGRSGATQRTIVREHTYDMRSLCGDVLLTVEKDTDEVRAVDLTTGDTLWKKALLTEMAAAGADAIEFLTAANYTPGSAVDRFIATRGSGLCGYDLRRGRLLWGARIPVTYWPMVHHGRVHVLYGNRFIGISEQTGEILYDRAYPELEGVIHPKAGTAFGGKIAMPAESGHLMVFDAADGRLVSLRKYEAPLWLTAEADGRLLVTARDGNLLVFEDGAVDIDKKPGAKKSTWKAPVQNVRYEGMTMIVEDTPEIVYETETRRVQMEPPKVAPLSKADEKDLETQRKVIAGLVKRAYGSRAKLSGTSKDVPILQGLIDQMWIGTSMGAEQIAMGVVLGDVLAKEHGLRWVIVTDEHGRTPALQNEETEGLTFPVTMVLKRYSRGEKVKLVPLLREIAKMAISGDAEAAGAKAGKSPAPSKSRRGS